MYSRRIVTPFIPKGGLAKVHITAHSVLLLRIFLKSEKKTSITLSPIERKTPLPSSSACDYSANVSQQQLCSKIV
ncbi:hypothetical protein SFRURICE_013351 [Spodoptera frugiperda]|nr:hypothetical protein SFRURICE_013351 [Spodoptera frugiperda]